MPTTVLVTGASGFIGQHVVADLVNRGFQVRVVTRGGHTRWHPAVEPFSWEGLHDKKAIHRAMAGADGVVHLAGRAHVMRSRAMNAEAYHRDNAEATEWLAEAAARAAVRTFILASSVKAVGEETPAPWSEDTPAAPVDPYGISKRDAELRLFEVAAAADLSATALRLPMVYGPAMKGNMLRLFHLVDRGLPLPLGGITNRRSIVYVENVSWAIRLLLQRSEPGQQARFISDGDAPSTPELLRTIAAALGRAPRLVPVPVAVLRLIGTLGDAAGRWVPIGISAADVRRLTESLEVLPDRLFSAIGRPPYTWREGISRTAAWFRSAQ